MPSVTGDPLRGSSRGRPAQGQADMRSVDDHARASRFLWLRSRQPEPYPAAPNFARLVNPLGNHVDRHHRRGAQSALRYSQCRYRSRAHGAQAQAPAAQHDGHHRGLRRRAGRQPFAIRLDHNCAVLIGPALAQSRAGRCAEGCRGKRPPPRHQPGQRPAGNPPASPAPPTALISSAPRVTAADS